MAQAGPAESPFASAPQVGEAAPAGRTAADRPVPRTTVIDCHCHAGHGDGLSHPSDTLADLDTYWRRARAAGITHAVLFATLNDDYTAANREVAGLVAAGRGRYAGFVFVNPAVDRGQVDRIVGEAVSSWGFRGIKVHWKNGRLTREIVEAAAKFRLPVLYDPRGELATVELAARHYPQVPFIIPHLGTFADDWSQQVAMIDKLHRFPNLFVDSSGVRYFDLLLDVISRVGPTKLLFGSDGPFLHPELELAKMRLLGLDPRSFDLVTRGNILRLLGPARIARRPAQVADSGALAGSRA